MPLLLNRRNSDLVELMDQPDCDKERLELTYQHFSLLNSLLSGWHRIYRRYIVPLAQNRSTPISLLDIGCGGGDIPIMLADWAAKDNISIDITAIDPDSRALDYARNRHGQVATGINFSKETAEELAEKGLSYDVVITNHVLHHLNNEQIPPFLKLLKSLARHYVLANDIRRSDVGFTLFYLGTALIPPFHKSFIRADGLKSIRRSFTTRELHSLAASLGYQITKPHPFRLLALYEH